MSSQKKLAAAAADAIRDGTGIVFDTQTKTVFTSLPRGNQNKIKEKISSVREVVPHKSNNEITLVLEHFEYNVADTIAAFLEDGAISVLKEWNCSGSNKANKKIKKKEDKKPQWNGVNATAKSPKMVKCQKNINNCRNPEPPINGLLTEFVDVKTNNGGNLGEKNRLETNDTQLTHSNSTVSDSLSGASSRQNSVSELKDVRHNSGKKSLEKPIKDLNRHSVSLQRVRHLLSEEFVKSEKRLKQSFQELHKILQDRETVLANELNEVKSQASNLLEGRISQANKLKLNSGLIDSMNSVELNDLRVDLKHFISERKFDEDLSRTTRFVRDHDRLVNEIRNYGEVVPAKALYTRRRRSVTSTESETPVVLPTNPVVVTTPTNVAVEKPVLATVGVAKISASSSSVGMSAAELTELHQKLQQSLRSQGLSVDSASGRAVRSNGAKPIRRPENRPKYNKNT